MTFFIRIYILLGFLKKKIKKEGFKIGRFLYAVFDGFYSKLDYYFNGNNSHRLCLINIPVYLLEPHQNIINYHFLYCGGNKRKASDLSTDKEEVSISRISQDNKRLKSELERENPQVDNYKERLGKLNQKLAENEQELRGISKELKEVHQTGIIDDNLPEGQKHKNNAMQTIKEKYPAFFDDESGNDTDRESLDQVKEYLQSELTSLQKTQHNLSTDTRKYQSILAWYNNNSKGGGSGSASGSGGGTSSDSGSGSGSSGQEGGSGDPGSSGPTFSVGFKLLLLYISSIFEYISTNIDKFFG